MTYLCILGRQPALGIAELESRLGSEAITIIQPDIIKLDTDQDVSNFNHVGGTQKVGRYLTTLNTNDWNKVSRQLKPVLNNILDQAPDSKITLGISVHGLRTNPSQINAAALTLKKTIKASGRSARIVPNNDLALNTAQVIHNKLTQDTGIELLLIQDGAQTIVASTTWVQDIESYRKRDQERPMRDARVGMLPPKLAQIIINMADPEDETNLLDPFCGTGVVLQEAILMGLEVQGSDLDPRMVEYSNKNLDWLKDFTKQNVPTSPAVVGDATAHRWSKVPDSIACETYLGRPLSTQPDQETLQKIIRDCDTIHTKFFRNVARQTPSGFRMCVAVPAWYTKKGFKHMPTLDHLEELGYNRVSFVHAETSDLIYHREGQIVARELVVLIRK